METAPPIASEAPPVIPVVLQQHVEDAAILHSARTALISAPHAQLHHLRRFDDRLAAHLDGVAIGGAQALRLCESALEAPDPSVVFVAAVGEIEEQNFDMLTRLLALVAALPSARPGLVAAFGWLEPNHLRGVVAQLLGSSDPLRRWIGIAACAAHRVDPQLVGARRMQDGDASVRARALRTAGELGKRDLVSTCAAQIEDKDPTCQFWAAWSAVLLGDRQRALDVLAAAAREPGAFASRAFQLALIAMSAPAAHALLKELARDEANVRRLIQGAGLVGDATYIPWLIDRMSDDKLARLSGEAFSFITGADLAWLDIERKPPEGLETGPNDNPDDPDVDMDPDDGLPWPDEQKVRAWWEQNAARFSTGTRYFVGAPPTQQHCIHVLRTGYQRQRIAAALHRCVLAPGTPLFEWRAPAWRQQRELATLDNANPGNANPGQADG